MKHLLHCTLAVLLGAGLALAQPAPAPGNTDAVKQLMSAAQALARDNKAEVTAVAAAYEKVLQLPELSTDQRLQAHMDLARYYATKGKQDTAVAEYDRGLATANLTPAQQSRVQSAKAKMLFDSTFQGAFASYYTTGVEKAAAVYQQIIAAPECPNADKIAAYQGLANCQLELMDTKAANATLDAAVQLPNLSEVELVTAKKNKADALYRQLEYDAALALYQNIWSEKLQSGLRTPIEDRTLAILVQQNRIEEARQALLTWKRPALSMANFYLDNGKVTEAQQIYQEILNDPKNSYRDRSEAVEKLLQTYVANKDLQKFYTEAEQRIPALIAENEQAWNIYRRFLDWPFTRHGVGNNPTYTRWVSEKIISNPKVSAGDYLKYTETQATTALQRGDFAKARDIFTLLLAKELNTPTRLRVRLTLAVLDSNGKANGMEARVDALLKELAIPDNDPKARAEALLTATRIAMSARYDQVARTLYAAREKMLVPATPRTLSCSFLPNGPKDITGFMQSEYFKNAKNHGRLDRKYGDNLQFLLETDSALTGRTVTAQEGNFTPTEFVATCDEEGVKIFFFAPTTKAQDIADGLTTMGGYEMYLAAGINEPYHCYLVDAVPGGLSDNFVTQYNNANFRRARQAEGTAKIEHAVYPNGVASLLSVSWNAFFNKLPKNGDAWDFEALHWEQGGYSWGGSESVHNRSSFGKLVFANLTPEAQRAIKRRVIATAANVYRRELNAKNGYVEIWQDPELGDQQFYAQVVQPLQKQLDGYLTKVKPGMSNEDVDLLYANAVPQWMNIKFLMANLRRDYLDARRVNNL